MRHAHTPFVTIVIPVLDDVESLMGVVRSIEPCPAVEVVVVNGGPPDARLAAVVGERRDLSALASPPGRGRQMNRGARAARGEWLLFLHADTYLPSGWLDELRRADVDPSVVAGSFRLRLDASAWQARLIERAVRWRVRCLGLAYGDQALFVRRATFTAVGGFRESPLMEDVDLIRRVRHTGRLYHSALAVVTSARRWERDGWWRRSAANLGLQLLFFAGAPPAWLAARYARPRGRSRREALVVMARAPSDPRGKSRLTAAVAGDPVELRRAILLDTLDVARSVGHADLFVAFEPAGAADELASLASGAAQRIPQHGETLGERMRHAFADVFGRGYATVVMVGSDLPTLPSEYIDQAFERLRTNRNIVALGPSTDGGYYLIGLRASAPALFENIPWSTSTVLSTTVRAAERLGLTVWRGPEWYDIDDRADLRRLAVEKVAAPRTRAWLAASRGDG